MNINQDEEYDGEDWKLEQLNDAVIPLKHLANEIIKTASAICASISEDDQILKDYRHLLMEDAYKLPVKISGAMATLDYILMMENAVVIKLSARNLLTACSGLDMLGYSYGDYLVAFRNELEEFKKYFAAWVRCFPREIPLMLDGWALFYTPEDIEIWNSMNPNEMVEE